MQIAGGTIFGIYSAYQEQSPFLSTVAWPLLERYISQCRKYVPLKNNLMQRKTLASAKAWRQALGSPRALEETGLLSATPIFNRQLSVIMLELNSADLTCKADLYDAVVLSDVMDYLLHNWLDSYY